MRIARREHVPGGFMVTVEHEAAYTDGSSRFEQVFVADAAVRGKTAEQVRQAVKDLVDDDPLAAVIGETIAAPAQTKDVLEPRLFDAYANWQRWKTTYTEAVARAEPAGLCNALSMRTDAAWARYKDLLQSWRSAP